MKLLFSILQENQDSYDSAGEDDLPEDCFHMISQVNWEDDIIWSPEDVKPNLQAMARAGWIPTALTRTAHAYATQQQTLFNQLGKDNTLQYDKLNLWRVTMSFLTCIPWNIF